MAKAGGPNEIGELSVGVTADLSSLKSAPAEAAKVGEEIGRATAEGMKRGASQVSGPGIGPQGGAVYTPATVLRNPTGPGWQEKMWTEMGGASLGQQINAAAPPAASSVAGPGIPSDDGWAKGAMGAMGAVTSAIGTAASAGAAGYNIGQVLADGFKAVEQLKLAMEQNNMLMQMQTQTRNARMEELGSGNPNFDTSVPQALVDSMRAKKQELTDRWNGETGFWGEVGRGADRLFLGPLSAAYKLATGDTAGYQAMRDMRESLGRPIGGKEFQDLTYAQELEVEASKLQDSNSKAFNAQLERGTVGGRFRAAGIDDPSLPIGSRIPISPAAARVLDNEIRINSQQFSELVKIGQMPNSALQEYIAKQAIGDRQVPR